MDQHPVFSRFAPHTGARKSGVLLDFIGAEFLGAWDNQPNVQAIEEPWTPPPPEYNEEYFEWVDVLESVLAAEESYTMMELGAGYGRWGIRAGRAACKRGIRDIRLVFVEGEPKHATWLGEALTLNRLADRSTVHEKAIAYGEEIVPFVISHETTNIGFGQCIGWEGEGTETERTYFGKPVRKTPAGYDQISVHPITFEEITAGIEFIDFVDMDLQRAELDVVQNSMDTLTAKVRRVHIGTHAPEIEEVLRTAFTDAGWQKVWDFGCQRINPTPFGDIPFVDGVQGWINSRFA